MQTCGEEEGKEEGELPAKKPYDLDFEKMVQDYFGTKRVCTSTVGDSNLEFCID